MQQARVQTLEETKPSRSFPSMILKYFLFFLVLGVGFILLSIQFTPLFRVKSYFNLDFKRSYSLCVEGPTDLVRWTKAPKVLMHNMSDEELLWSASFVPQIKNYPFKRVPKIAFMFLAKGPLPLYPLWEKFFSGHEGLYNIYIHSLPGYEAKYSPSSPFYRRQIPSKISEWGRMNLCDAERRLLANALLDISNERFVLLSESCIPIFNFDIVYKYLTKSGYSFINVFDDKGPGGRGRYNRNLSPVVNLWQWRKGSQWFEVNRKVAGLIVRDTKYYQFFEKFCRPACYVDEHYFQTMLSIEAPGLLANRSITMVDWSRGGAHPATFGNHDVTKAFLKKITKDQSCDYNGQKSSLCYLFARKFAPSTLEPLLELAPRLLGFG